MYSLAFDNKIQVYINDETELVIRILSFGPLVRVLGPENFVDLVKEKLKTEL